MPTLDKLLSRKSLEELAGTAAFQRGEEYFYANAVSHLSDDGTKLTARVTGTENYRVELWVDDGNLGYDCTCPRAADGYFCKHCVAAGLAWLEQKNEKPEGSRSSSGKKRERHDPLQAIRDYLLLQQPEALVELLLKAASNDDQLYQSLLLKAERLAGPENAIKAYRDAIDSATRIHDFIDWREAASFAGNLDQVVDSMQELLNQESVAALVELTEYAIVRTERALEQVDDSNGEVGEILDRMSTLHLKACELAKPGPTELAERLFSYEMTLPFDTFYGSARTYANVLDVQGLNRFRELAEAEWRKVKPLRAEARSGATFDDNRWRITHIMETLANISGDIEELVAIKSRDLSLAYHYLQIAEIYRNAGQQDKALDWAERGLEAFPDRTDNRLRDFLVGIYLNRGRNDKALQLTWIQFEEQPHLEHYKKLSAVATRLKVWPQQRQRALQRIDAAIAAQAKVISRWKPKSSMPDQSPRAEIALWENDLDAAWHAVHQGTCRQSLLIALAEKLEATRATDAIALYRKVIPDIVEQTSNRAYEEAITLIRKVGKLMKAQGQAIAFGEYLAELRVQYKPKRNFIKLLDGVIRVH